MFRLRSHATEGTICRSDAFQACFQILIRIFGFPDHDFPCQTRKHQAAPPNEPTK